jgi:phage/plasmid-like protein (TIGR03299 family)
MSHQVEKIVYVGETPWHQLGTKFVGGESFEQWILAAGFGWDAIARPLSYQATNALGEQVAVNLASHKVLVRSDLQTELGVVGKDYKIVQPKQIMEFFRDIAFASGSRYTMETAGVLSDGKRIWALARTQNVIRVRGQDVILPYLLLGTTFDGKGSTFADYTSVRVVCNNTLTMSVGSHGERANVRIPHTSVFDEGAVKKALGLIEAAEDGAVANFEQTADVLAGRAVDDKEMFNYFAALYGPKREEGQSVADLKVSDFTDSHKATINELIALFKNGPGSHLVSAEGTAWGLVNAVTRFEDRRRPTLKGLASSQFGAGAHRKVDAVGAALALAA